MTVKQDVIKRYSGTFLKLYSSLRMIILPMQKIDDITPKNGKILDYGCGYGVTSTYLALSHNHREVIGIEQDRSRINIAEKVADSVANLSIFRRDVTNMHHVHAKAHLLIDVIHHVPYIGQISLLNGILKAMSKNDLLIIKEIDKKPLFKYWWNYMHDKVMTGNDPLFFRTCDWYTGFLGKKGLKCSVIRCENVFYPHFIVIARK